MSDLKFSRGQFVQLGDISMMRGRIIEAKPGRKRNKYKVRMIYQTGPIRTYWESQLKLCKEQRWL